MAKYLGSKLKLCRREGTDLFLKSGLRGIETKCKINRLPGQHGYKKSRLSDYGFQLREKQKLRRMYNILEKQFFIYYKKALNIKGNTGEILLQLLERRLDNVVYRMGFASTRLESRQLVNHKLILLNNKIVNIPSYLVCSNDLIKINNKAKSYIRIKYAIELSKQREKFSWLEVNYQEMEGIFKFVPDRSLFALDVNEHLIIEFYSK